MYLAVSCSKDVNTGAASSAQLAAAIQTLQAIGIGTTKAASNASADSIYVINTCARNASKDSIAFTALPAAVNAYLESTYAGYTFQKAFSIINSSGVVTGYVVIINYNGSAAGLKFDAEGIFIKILEQQIGRDLAGCIQKSDSTSSN